MTPSDLTGLPDNILRKMVEEARAEAARQALLVQRYEPAYLGLPHVVRERDEAREEVGRLRAITSPGDAAAFEEYMAAREAHWVRRVARLEGLLLSVARVIRGRDGLPCWCDDYDARPDHTHSAKCIEARRVAELERDYAEVQDISVQEKLRADAAEARLARCVEALGEIRGRSLAAKTHEVGPLEAKGRLTRILELACAALAAAKGGE